jgi:2-octaprenyl-6-methoxyphenol hydroxylase
MMKKQKICIIGGSLTGLVTAISLSKLNFEIDLITGNFVNNSKSSRTITVSENNFHFLNKLNISKLLKKEIWICSKMKLYTESESENFSEIFELNKEGKNENIFYILENSKIMSLMLNKIKKIKSISLKKNKIVSSINNSGLLKSVKFNNNISKYSLVIICTGYNSSLVRNIFNDKMIENLYKEFAVTTIINHKPFKNNIARQIFLDESIFAMLPISKTKTSIVWSLKNFMKEKNNSFLKKRIKIYASKYLKEIKFNSKIEKNDLNLLIRNKYYLNRTLLFGDALHSMHPFIGQSFNMTLRDLICLEKILEEKINLGLDIGSSDVLSEFSDVTKSRNFSFSIGSDILKNVLSFKKARNDIFKILNKSNLAKNIIFDVADKGLRF